MTPEQTKIINRYGRAYRAANGSTPPSILNCGRGIFKIAHHRKAHRISRFVEWSKRLEERAVGKEDDSWLQ